jgi:hypothetical protein
MRRLLALLLLCSAVALCCVSPEARAGATGDWNGLHVEQITVPQRSLGSSFPRLYNDSTSFYLEGTTSAKAAVYDTVSMKDTLASIQLKPGVGSQVLWTLGATGDSIWVGRLTLRFATALASTDSLFFAVDASPDGYTWVSQSTSSVNGWLQCGTGQGAAQIVSRDVWINNYEQAFAPATGTTNAAYNYWGARALRIRISLGKSSAVKLVSWAKWTYPSVGPDEGE